MVNRELLTKIFDEYTSLYDMNNPKIRLKAEHTYRVAALSDAIVADVAVTEGLTKEDQDLAWAIGMLHDIGRFEQARIYNTFMDGDSVDHAEFGADLLFSDHADPRLTPVIQILPEPALVELAIRNHNKYRVQEGVSHRERIFCDIIRDADKIDILKANVDFTAEEIYGVKEEELLAADITDAVLEQALSGTAVDRRLRRTPMDTVVSLASMMQELNYPISRRIVKEQGNLKRFLDKHPVHQETAEKLEILKAHLKELI